MAMLPKLALTLIKIKLQLFDLLLALSCALNTLCTVEHVRRGRKIMYRMNTHRCPTCDRAVQSVRRALC